MVNVRTIYPIDVMHGRGWDGMAAGWALMICLELRFCSAVSEEAVFEMIHDWYGM